MATEIAIVGSGCQFPGSSNSPSKLWDLLRNPRVVASKIPGIEGYYHHNAHYHGHSNVKEAYFLDGDGASRRFDAAFFNINPVEAAVLDPQVRLLLETVYEALEAGGQAMEALQNSDTAVYAGQMLGEYELLMYRDSDSMGTYHSTGASRTQMSNRISYFFDWHGPSMTIDTACSSSLVALHHAVQQLRSGQSRVAVAVGANLLLDVENFISESKLQMLSPEGRSKMWDADANGYARGEGVAAVVLKRLADAEADGDHIECVIRETAVNQDGKTPGMTMPSATAQTQLMQDCYARAGLDLSNPAHRPQYFEAHGTGTPAGDPIEAEAISSALFSSASGDNDVDCLYVGSIKTVIGHTEGASGLAGVLKASLCLQHAEIPPNLLFKRLNPHIQPFYNKLRIPTSITPWPVVAGGGPRRASVNSFGFGGTNAHAILESYVPRETIQQPPQEHNICSAQPTFIPFVFSAASEKSLKSNLANFCDFLRRDTTAGSLRDIAYTLNARRTHFPIATTIAASTTQELIKALDARLEIQRESSDQATGTRVSRQAAHESIPKPRILGVFTGQGAQWARMGAELISSSRTARLIIADLQTRLDGLPAADRPSWSILEELQREEPTSRINEAELSQTLCTAVQILQVELLRAAGIQFSAVVGHSSGEIAAAYAAGSLTAGECIAIAYYRGLYAGLSQGSCGQKGAMLAVGTSEDDAQDLLDYPKFRGRACIAAINSPTSVTISGDQDAIDDLKIVFEDEQRFTRILKVDKAYHSHHMRPCAERYSASLGALNVQASCNSQAVWFSSVSGEEMSDKHDIFKQSYWIDNMVKPVLFMQAIENACASMGAVDLIMEIGPHPALKAPTLQTLHSLMPQVPYTGLFRRSVSAVTSFADGLGHAWTYLGKGCVDLQGYDRFVSGDRKCNIIKGLPSYAWDHDKEYWHESRYARAARLRPGPVNDLLGHLTPNSTDQDMRWRHIMRPIEIPWLSGHQLHNIIVFPGAGYVVMALEAAVLLCQRASTSPMRVDVFDIDIFRALVFEKQDTSMETIFSLTDVSREKLNTIDAKWRFHATSGHNNEDLELMSSGRLRVHLGEPSSGALPARPAPPANLVRVGENNFYESLHTLGYHYSGPFVALGQLERKLGFATGIISQSESCGLFLHPAVLDAAFHSLFLTYAAPGDGALWSLHVPRKIRRVTVNPVLCGRNAAEDPALRFDAFYPLEQGRGVTRGDIDIYPTGVSNAMVQIQGLEVVPFSRATAKDDKETFSTMVWDLADPAVDAVLDLRPETAEQQTLALLLERTARFYLRQLQRSVPLDHPCRVQEPYKWLFNFASHSISADRAPQLPLWLPEWENDTANDIREACEPFSKSADIKLLSEMGCGLVDITKGDKSAPTDDEVTRRATLLNQWYTAGLGIADFTVSLACIVKQVVHRYPRMNILEICTGNDATTKKILGEIGSKFSSYTITNISQRGLEAAAPVGSEDSLDKLIFKALDISRDPGSQGFAEHSYDLVVASLVLHRTPHVAESLENARRLLKTGGYLVVLELLPNPGSFFGVVFGSSVDWWSGAQEGRVLSPAISPLEWDGFLRDTGFSGIDSAISEQENKFPFYLFVSQAVDHKISFLREPLSEVFSVTPSSPPVQELLVIGGTTLTTDRLCKRLTTILGGHCASISCLRALTDLLGVEVKPDTTVLSLSDLDRPVFAHLSSDEWEGLRRILSQATTVVWVSQGRRINNPHANMMAGLVRTAKWEYPNLDYLLLDIEDSREINAQTISEALVRHVVATKWLRRNEIQITVEPELVLKEGGRWTIPRLMINQAMNNRYNSARRLILEKPRSGTTNLLVSASDIGWEISEDVLPDGGLDCNNLGLRTTHSLLSAIRVHEFGFLFAILGQNSDSGHTVIALSAKHSSVLCPYKELFIPVKIDSGLETQFLCLVVHYLLASLVLDGLYKGSRLFIHEPAPEFASMVAEEARELGVRIICTTSREALRSLSDTACGVDWLVFSPTAPDRDIIRLTRGRVAAFVDMSTESDTQDLSERIRAALPRTCRRDSIQSLLGAGSSDPPQSQLANIHERLKKAVSSASRAIRKVDTPTIASLHSPAVSIDVLPDHDGRLAPLSIIDWTNHAESSVSLRPVDSQISFSDSMTYWLVGLSGSIGLSLCEWMIRHGARYFVLSSRKPEVASTWLQEMQIQGAVIKVAACDITRNQDVVTVYDEICKSMPPVAGVAQGAMVLHDTSVKDMTLQELSAVTKPKVQGSIHLDNLFQNKALDFFIFFSSMVSVVGNYGQANYSAANAFMLGLAEQRRQRGLAASVIHIGPVLGLGYVNRASDTRNVFDKALMERWAYVATSEHDLHQIFAEAVLAGRPGSDREIEILSGLRRVSQNEEPQPKWMSNPIMSHLIQSTGMLDQAANAGSHSRLHVKEQLLHAENHEEVYGIIKAAFAREVSSLFHLEPDQLAKADLGSLYFDQMGVDSLSAGEIRSWFTKNLEINIPVLRILNGGSVGELITTATETIPARLVPKLSQVSAASSDISSSETSLNGLGKVDDLATSPSSHTDFSGERMDLSSISDPQPNQNSLTNSSLKPKRSYPLSVTQAEYWSIWSFIEDKTALNHTGVARMTGKIDTVRLQGAVRAVARQHEILRTCFVVQDGVPMQCVMENGPLKLECRQVSTEEDVQKVAKAVHEHVYDVSAGETMRLVFLSRSPTDHFLVFGLNPLAIDGISFQLFMKWLLQHYTHPYGLLPKVTQFVEFSERQHADLAAGKYKNDMKFWKSEFASQVPPLPIMTLSTATSRPAITTYADERANVRIDKEIKTHISSVCRRLRSTPFHFYTAVFRALLLRYTVDGEDISIGMTDANRKEEDLMSCIGPFRNILPLRLCTQASSKFQDLLATTRDKAYSALAHSSVPFSVLLSELNIPKSKTYSPLFQCIIDYRLGQREKTSWGVNSLHFVSFETERSPCDVFVEVVDDPNGDCLVYFGARKDLYDKADVERFAKSYEYLVQAFALNPALEIDEPDVVDPSEIEEVMRFSQGPICASQWPETVVHRVDQIMQQSPDGPALRYEEGKTTSYAEVVGHSVSIASALYSLGIGPGSIVAVLQERTPGWISSILGIMRTGAAYVPLELNMPWPRLASTARDCHPSVVLADDDTEAKVNKLEMQPGSPVINIARLSRHEQMVPIAATEHGTAAILYTSGSTGNPKGVVLTHENVRNWVETVPPRTTPDMKDEVVLGQVASSFDMCISQIFTALCHGGTLYIVSREDCKNSRALTEIMAREGITLTCATPSEYAVWFNYGRQGLLRCRSWKTAMTIGEPAPPALPAKFASLGHRDLRYINMYGPAESSFTCCFMHVPYEPDQLIHPSSRSLAAGYTQPNYTMYVLDAKLRPVPVGVQGEIYIGGAGIGNGYLGMLDLTAERFVPVPDALSRAVDREKGWSTLHRSGDLGRWREDGAILIEGRTAGDTQVKVQGVRVGLLEMEFAIVEAARGAVSEAAVSVHPPDVLVAHIVFNKDGVGEGEASPGSGSERTKNVQAIEAHLAKTLPLYMRLAAIIPIDSLPRTINGKIDRKAIRQLPLPESSEDDEEGSRELTPTEARLKKIWEEVIAGSNSDFRRTVTPTTDFFHVGGTSMLLLGLRARIQEVFEFNMRLMGMFENSTLAAMAEAIDNDHAKAQQQQRQRLQAQISEIDWDEETALPDKMPDVRPEEFSPRLSSSSALSDPRSKVVVLTGATGLLGRALLDALLADESIKHVHCLGVRNAFRRHDLPKLDGHRATLHPGDLTFPRLGLSEEDAQRIFAEADIILHNGADMSHGRTYASLRACNVQATKELAMMSSPRRLPFHYISSLGVGRIAAAAQGVGVAGDKDKPTEEFIFGPVSVSAYSPVCLAADSGSAAGAGYGIAFSKWASERFLERLHERYDDPPWPVWIHRPGQFVPATSPDQAHGLRLASNIRHYASKLRAVPVLADGRMGGAIEFVPLDVVVQGVVSAVLTSFGESTCKEADSLRFSHHLGDDRLVLDELRTMLGKGDATSDECAQVAEMDMTVWARKAGELGMHPTIVALLEDFARAGTLIFPKLVA